MKNKAVQNREQPYLYVRPGVWVHTSRRKRVCRICLKLITHGQEFADCRHGYRHLGCQEGGR